jgi:hypothetical protein
VDTAIEPDLSNAAPFLMLALVSGGLGDRARLAGEHHPARRRTARPARAHGRHRHPGRRGLTVTGGDGIHGIDADLHDVGELTPALAALCALADSPSYLRGIAHIRGHETDRLAALATELKALGPTSPRPPTAWRSGRATARRAGSRRTPTTGWRTPGWCSAPGSTGCWWRTSRPRRRRSRASRRVGGAVRGMSPTGRYGEEDHESYERPRRHTRPRTKERPTYDDAVEGRVMTVDRGRYTCLVDGVTVTAMKSGRWAARAWSSATGCGSWAT